MMHPQKTSQPRWIDFDGEKGQAGELYYWEKQDLFPNGIQRCFWVHSVPEGVSRGNHAHREETQVLVALAGEIRAKTTDTLGVTQVFKLNHPSRGLLIPPLHWVETDFSSDAVLLALSDREFSEADYIRDLKEFAKL